MRGLLITVCVFLGILLISNLDKGILPIYSASSEMTSTFSFHAYVLEILKQVQNYQHGDLGQLHFKSFKQVILPIAPLLGQLIGNSLTNLLSGVFLGILVGYAIAVCAAWKPQIGKWIDKLHLVLLGVPDFFIVVLLQLVAILIAKAQGHKVLTVFQFANDVPFLIPFLAISVLPALIIYGTMRIAIARE